MKKKSIHRKKSKIHAWGVYASETIPKGARIVPYTGRKLLRSVARSKENQDYLFELNQKYDIDGRNIARYINHSCDPNCDTDVIEGKIWINSIREIKPGEELSYNYGYTLKEGLQYPCRCGAKRCAGYIMDDEEWPKLRKIKKKKIK